MSRHFSILKNSGQEREHFKNRIKWLVILMMILVGVLVVRLFYLQVFQRHFYTTLAKQNQLNLFPLAPNRGLIFDRNGKLLAENIPVFNLVVTPNLVPDLEKTLQELLVLMAIDEDDMREFYRQLKLHRSFQPIVLKTRLTEEQMATFAVNQFRFPGVSVQPEMVRVYPGGKTFASVVGYVGRINAKELQQVDPANYSATNFIGKTGVEKFNERILHGVVGFQQVEVNVAGQVVRVLNQTSSEPGANLYLTIDGKLQAAAMAALANQRGAIVAINPQNGEVIAFASAPSFDPNLFTTGISQEDFEALQQDLNRPLYNRALRGQFPPGSTIKPYVALEGLSTGIVTPDDSITDPGWFQLPNSSHIYHDWRHHGHGVVNIIKAIVESCDTYFYHLSNRLGVERLDAVLSAYGFGEKTGIDLPDEASGLLPSPEWKKQKLDQSWYPGDTLIMGIGQGFLLATPLQLASNIGALAMQGQHWKPHVVARFQLANGQWVVQQPVLLSQVKIDPKAWQVVMQGMQGVVNQPNGTAYEFFRGVPYTLAAKSGTAQVFSLKKDQKDEAGLLPTNLRDNALFVAFAPVDHPRIAIAVLLQNSSIHAAQIARQVLDAYFAGQNNE